jgi:fucose 4-O-acetylase-like acetyltransferase
MDALRASTMFLLVPVHAAGLLAVNGHPGEWATAIFWTVHVFRLPLFFAMSGFFLALLLQRKGLEQTANNRTMRIAVPLLVGIFTLVPLMLLASQATGTAINDHGRVAEGTPFRFELNFLWFLWYLLIADGLAVAVYLLAPKALRAAGRAVRWAIGHPIGGLALLALPTAASMWPAATWMTAPTRETFVPQPEVLAYYLLFFGLGATLYTHRDVVDAANRNAWKWAACALGAAIPAGALFSLHNTALGEQAQIHGMGLLLHAIATWSSLVALVGLADRYLNRPHPKLRYIADSSYWIYLSHLPVMVLITGLLAPTALALAPKFAIVTGASLAFSLATYPLLVRYTVIGRVLNGPRPRPQRTLLRRPAAGVASLIR